MGVPDHQTWIPLERTVLPASWFASPEQWELLLARRWRHHVHINVGELRASTLLFRIFCAATGPRRLRVLDVTDSMVTNGVLTPTHGVAAADEQGGTPQGGLGGLHWHSSQFSLV